MSNEINLQEFKMHEKDSGSSSFQIALLTKRIAHLTAHLGENKHDVSSRRGLLKWWLCAASFLTTSSVKIWPSIRA